MRCLSILESSSITTRSFTIQHNQSRRRRSTTTTSTTTTSTSSTSYCCSSEQGFLKTKQKIISNNINKNKNSRQRRRMELVASSASASVASASASASSFFIKKRRRRMELVTSAVTQKIKGVDDNGNYKIPFEQTVSIIAVMLAAFFHLLGFTATGPITPELVRHFAIPGSKIGYLTSAYPFGMFFALFVWPRLSDLPLIGRKKIMTLSLLGVGASLIAQAKCVSLGYSFETFLGLRVLAGCCSGASPVIKAYLADVGSSVSSKNNGAFTARLMGWREACCTLAFVVGPTVGGIICSGFDLSATIAFTGYASILASILVLILVVEPNNNNNNNNNNNDDDNMTKSKEQTTANDDDDNMPYDADNLSCPLGISLVAAVGTICVISFLYNAGQSTFDSFFPLVISRTAGMGPTMIGATLTSLSLVSLCISSLLFAPIFKMLGLTKTCGIGLALVASGLFIIGISNTPFTIGLGAFLYCCGVPLFTPSIPILLMQCVPTTSRGAVMGFDSAINSSARIIMPVLLGSVFAASRGRAFICASACVAAAFAIVIIRSFTVFKQSSARAEKKKKRIS